MGVRAAAGPGFMVAVAASACVLTGCEVPGEGVQGPGTSTTTSPPAEGLVCPGNSQDTQFDYDMSDPAFGHATAKEAITLGAVGESLPEGEDVEVSPTRWHRVDDGGRVVVEFRVQLSPEGEHYLDGYTLCSNA